MSLRLADKYVKEGNYVAALDAIAKARQVDPTNPYAIAYEERVRTLLNARRNDSGSESHAEDRQNSQASSPNLEQISRLAIEQEKTSAAASSIYQQETSWRKREDEERQRQEELRAAAIGAKLGTLLTRAQQLLEHEEFTRALDELSRILVLDPGNKQAHVLESRVHTARKEAEERKERERSRKKEDEELKRQEQLQAELAQIKREQEERKLKTEGARTVAQKQKVEQYLASSLSHLAEGRLQEAQNELAFVVVIDPLNPKLISLGEQIREAHKQQRQAEIELRHKREEEERKRQEEVQAAIREHIENANQLISQEAFREAFHILTQAYLLDPVNELIQECENRAIAAEEGAIHRETVKRAAEEEQQLRHEEEQQRQRVQIEREQLLHGNREENEARCKEDREECQIHLARAKGHLELCRFEGALAEIALAFLIDPFSNEVQELEQLVHAEQAQHKNEHQRDELSPPPVIRDDTDTNAIAGHVAEANRLREQREYARALDELAKAFILDPLNQSIQECEEVIQTELMQFQMENSKSQSRTDVPDQRSTEPHASRAQDLIARHLYDEALAEIALGLTHDPNDHTLLQLESSAWALKTHNGNRALETRDSDGTQRDEKERVIEIHLLAAEEFVAKRDFTNALDELAKAFAVDPLNSNVQKMEHLVRQLQPRYQKGTAEA